MSTTLALLLGLLAASYLGSAMSGAGRGRMVASGAPWLLLGLAVGPHALGLVDGAVLATFRALAAVAIGWVAVAVGLEYAFVGDRRIGVGRLAGSTLLSLLCGLSVAAAVGGVRWWLAPEGGFLASTEDRLLALGIGAALADTSREAFRWGYGASGARGPLSDLLAEVGDGDDLAPVLLLGTAFLVAEGHSALAALPSLGGVPAWLVSGAARALAEPLLGAVLGLTAAALFGRDFRRTTVLGVLFGTSLVALGLSARLGLSLVGAGFVLGLTLALASSHRAELRTLALEVERPVLLPALILAGALVDPAGAAGAAPVVAAAVGARLLVKALHGGTLSALHPVARQAGLAGALCATGPLGVVVGLAFELRFPGPLGGAVLAAAVGASLLGEVVSTPSIRQALRRAGELDAEPAEDPSAAGHPASATTPGGRL